MCGCECVDNFSRVNREEGDYFFPCALPSCDKLNDPPTEIQPLLIAWEINNSGTTTLAIPQGLFPLTIVYLLEQKDKVDFCPVGKDYYRYNDAMSLRVYKIYTIDIINCYTHIEIRLDESSKEFCPQICELVTDAIKKSSKDLNVTVGHIFAFKCSMDEHCYCIVKEDKSSTRCTQCRSQCDVLQGDDDSYRCWFNDSQSSSSAKQLEEDEVELKATDINMQGAPGADGSQHLLDEPPPEKLTDSTQESESKEQSTVPTPTVTDEIDTEKITKWLEEGKVDLEITRINIHGAPGAGKTCSQRLLLNEPPPNLTWCQVFRKILEYFFNNHKFALTDSTPIACRAVKATRISIGDKNKWERVDEEDLLKQLASPEDNVLPTTTSSNESSLEGPTKSKPTKNGSAKNGPTDPPRMDPPRMDPPRMDPPRMDPPRMDPPRMDPPRMDPPRMDPPRMDPPRMDPPRMDPPRMDPPRMDPPRMDPPRMDPPRMDPPRMDPPRMDPPRMDPPRMDPPRMDPPRIDPPRMNPPTENGLAKNGSTENEQAELFKLMKKLINYFEANEYKKLSKNWVYFIDSGGQPAYRELLPLFTRAAALNIITIDLTKGLDEKCQFQYRISQHMSLIDTELKYSNRDLIRSTISSEAMLNPVEIPYVTHMPDHSYYLILGTREELVTEEKLKEMNESLKEYIANDKVIPHNKRKDSIIFPVNTLLRAGSKKREKASEKLCTAISKCGAAMKITLPIRFFTFEIGLQMEAKKRSFLTKEEAIKIGKFLGLDESEIKEALQYLHNVTIILYYPAVLPNIIFVNPEPILDVLSRLIAVTYVHISDSTKPLSLSPSWNETRYLTELGFFKKDLLEKIGNQIFDKDFESSDMITLLKHLHIIAKVENRKEGDYFFPCALPSYDKLDDSPTNIQPLLIAWEITINSGTTTLAIPQGLFPLTIVHLLEEKDVNFSPDPYLKKEFYRYHDAMSLCVYEKYYIDIINRYTHIEIRFRGYEESCRDKVIEVRGLVKEVIKKSSKLLEVEEDNNFIFAFKCPKKENCIVQEKDKSKKVSSTGTRCHNCHPQCEVLNIDDSYRCWFSDQLPSDFSPVKGPTAKVEKAIDNSNSRDHIYPSNNTKCSVKYFKSLGCCIFMILLVLAGVGINYFVVRQNTEDSLTISTGASPAQCHQDSTTLNPVSDGAGQLGIKDLDMVTTVLEKALFGPAEWNNLGLKLGLLEPTTLGVIRADSGGNAYEQLRRTIAAWLRGEDNAKSRTWQTLIDAVEGARDRAAAERIPKELKSLYGITLNNNSNI